MLLKRKILNSIVGSIQINWLLLSSERISSRTSSSILIRTYIKLNNRGTGLTLLKGKIANTHREYNYDVRLKGLGYSIMAANLVYSWRIFVNKRMVFWPAAIIPVAYYMITPVYL